MAQNPFEFLVSGFTVCEQIDQLLFVNIPNPCMLLVSMLREAKYHGVQENRITLHECSNLQFQSVTGPQWFYLV